MRNSSSDNSKRLARPPLVLVPQHFGSLVFDRRTSRYLPFDNETTDILLALVSTPVDVMIANTSEQRQRSEIAVFFEEFYSRGFFTMEGHFAAEVLEVSVPADHLVGPLALHLEVVAACNLACNHCFAGVLPREEKGLTLDELDRLFAEMASLGTAGFCRGHHKVQLKWFNMLLSVGARP
jgi:hypothetical protein